MNDRVIDKGRKYENWTLSRGIQYSSDTLNKAEGIKLAKEDNKLQLIPKIERYMEYMLQLMNRLPRTEKFSIETEYNFGMLLLLSTIVTFHIIIGANDKDLRILPISILLAFIILYFIIIKIKNKEHSIFLKTKTDYLVLAFMLTTTLPFIFKTHSSYSDNIEFIMKYFFIYSVYILARNVLKDKKSIELTITITLISSLIPAILGLDILYGHFCKRPYKMSKLGLYSIGWFAWTIWLCQYDGYLYGILHISSNAQI